MQFADADSGGTDKQEWICGQIIGSAQFPLQELVLLEGKRAGKIAGLGRKVLMTDEIGKKGVAVGRPCRPATAGDEADGGFGFGCSGHSERNQLRR
jgi:hypothetical protein